MHYVHSRHLIYLTFVALLVGIVGCEVTAATPTPTDALTATVTSTLPPTATQTATPAPESTQPAGQVEQLVPDVLNVYPHDAKSFTQGLVWYEGTFYESAGRYGVSNLRQVELKTGKVLREVPVEDKYFAEGLALVDDKLIQITWRENTALVYDLKTFDKVGQFSYTGEGWGLCYDGKQLYMSDGSNLITARDPKTFEATQQLTVTLNGNPVVELNELECVGDSIYANIWQTNTIVRIDKVTGLVTATIDATNLLTPQETTDLEAGGTLNGIAYNPDIDTFYVTGKLWPKLFEVRFVTK